MSRSPSAAVTGAFGYTGKYITRRLLKAGVEVLNLTGHPDRVSDLAGRVAVAPLRFDDPASLTRSLQGVGTLYNTYWIRFEHRDCSFAHTVQNSRVLFAAARDAGVAKIVHVSITNPDIDSPLPYFSGKALVEQALMESTVPYAIVRPTVIFGAEDIFINNVAWMLKTFPVFAVPGNGRYRLQPVFVDDVASICVDAGESNNSFVTDAAGPEIMTFKQMLQTVRAAVDARCVLVDLLPSIALTLARVVSGIVRDVVLTPGELSGLMSEMIVSQAPASATTRFSEWVAERGHLLGRKYSSELKRHYLPGLTLRDPDRASLLPGL